MVRSGARTSRWAASSPMVAAARYSMPATSAVMPSTRVRVVSPLRRAARPPFSRAALGTLVRRRRHRQRSTRSSAPTSATPTVAPQASVSTRMARCSALVLVETQPATWSAIPVPRATSRHRFSRISFRTTSSRRTFSCCRWSAGACTPTSSLRSTTSSSRTRASFIRTTTHCRNSRRRPPVARRGSLFR